MNRRYYLPVLAALLVIFAGCHVLLPFPPGPPRGPERGSAGERYAFSAVTHDPQGDMLRYRFTWTEDGEPTEWSEPRPSGHPVEMQHAWELPGRYAVRAQAKDIWGLESEWSPPHHIHIGGGQSGYPDTIVARVDAGRDPVGIAAGPDGRHVYVAARGDNQLVVISAANNNVVARVDVGSSPHAVCVLPNGQYAYVANSGSGNVSVVRLSDLAVVATVPVGSFPYICTPSPDNQFVYVTNRSSYTVSKIRTSDNTVVGTVHTEPVPWGSAITNCGQRLYVGGSGESRVQVIRTSDMTIVDTVMVSPGPEGMCTSPDGRHVYVACHAGDWKAISVGENTVAASVGIGGYPVDTEVLPSGSHAYVASHVGGTIRAIDLATNSVVWTAEGASGPNYMAALPSGDAVYVCCNFESRVWVIGRR